MIFKKKKYNWVNEKVVDGVLYQCFRCENEPKKTIIISDDKRLKKIKEVSKLREEWKKLG